MDSPDLAQLLKAVRGAQTEIIAYTPLMAHRALAQELGVAIKERGVKVYLLTREENYWNKNGYTGWLSAQHVTVYGLIGASGRDFLVVDRRWAFVGSEIGQPNRLDSTHLALYRQGSELAGRYNWSIDQMRRTVPLQLKDRLAQLQRPR